MLGDTNLIRLVVVRDWGPLVIELRRNMVLESSLTLGKVSIQYFQQTHFKTRLR